MVSVASSLYASEITGNRIALRSRCTRKFTASLPFVPLLLYYLPTGIPEAMLEKVLSHRA